MFDFQEIWEKNMRENKEEEHKERNSWGKIKKLIYD